jgi:hypothetical protein
MPPAVAAKNAGVGPCRGETCGDILEAMASIAPSQPNEAMARVAPRRNGTISLGASFRVEIPEKGSLDIDSELFSKGRIDSKKSIGLGCSRKRVAHHQSVTEVHNFAFSRAAVSAGPPM